jgi:hypothetical protein
VKTNDVSRSNVKTLSTVTTFQNSLEKGHISVTTKMNKTKACKTPVTQSIARLMRTVETPQRVSTIHVNQSSANTMPIAVKIIFVKRLTRKIQERTSVKKLIVLLMLLANLIPTKTAKMVNVSAKGTSVNHKSVSSLNTVQTNTIAMITNVLNKSVTPMIIAMVTIPHTNVSLTV